MLAESDADADADAAGCGSSGKRRKGNKGKTAGSSSGCGGGGDGDARPCQFNLTKRVELELEEVAVSRVTLSVVANMCLRFCILLSSVFCFLFPRTPGGTRATSVLPSAWEFTVASATV